jgi:hypothetical protein
MSMTISVHTLLSFSLRFKFGRATRSDKQKTS